MPIGGFELIKKKPDKIVCAGGREFRLYRYHDEEDGRYILDLPDFAENPEYTDEGRPFMLHVQDGCPNAKARNPDDTNSSDCGCCYWFYQDEPFAPIGVCMCDALRRESKEEQSV